MTPEWKDAVTRSDVVRLDQLLRAGANVDATDEHGQTALMLAARDGRTAVVRCMLDHGAETDHTAKFGLSALMLAVINGHAEIVRAIANAGANQTIRGTGAPGFYDKTAVDLARQKQRPDLVEALRPTERRPEPSSAPIARRPRRN